MLTCTHSGQEKVWGLAKELWKMKMKAKIPWPMMKNIGSITRCALASFSKKKSPKNSKKGENRFYKFLLSELIMLIWVLWIERVYKGSQEHSKEEIRARWVSRLNEKLRLDRAVTCYDSHGLFLFFSHLLHFWLIVLTLTPLWLIYPYYAFHIYMARYPPVTLAWSDSNIPEF